MTLQERIDIMKAEWDTAMLEVSKHPSVAPFVASFRRVSSVIKKDGNTITPERKHMVAVYMDAARAYAAGSIDAEAFTAAEERLIKDWLHAGLEESLR